MKNIKNKSMKHIKSLLLIIILFPLYINAQPTTWVKPFTPEIGKGKGFYVRNGENELKEKNYLKAAAYTAKALTMDLSKRQRKKSIENLKAAYSAFIENHKNSISEKNDAAQNEISDEEMNRRYGIYKLYSEMQSVDDILNSLSPDKLKSKKASFSFSHTDRSKEIKEAMSHLNAGKPAAAKIHFEKAEKLFDPEKKERLTNKAAAKEYRIAQLYYPEYEGVAEKYNKAKELGTAKVSIHHFQARNPQDIPYLVPLSTEQSMYKTLKSTADGLNYLELFPDLTSGTIIYQNGNAQDYNKKANEANFIHDEKAGTHFRVVCTYEGYDVKKEVNDPTVEDVEKEIVVREVKTKDSEGNTKTQKIKEKVNAKVTTYSKDMYVSITAQYKVIEIATGKVISEGESSAFERWSHSWARYSGNEKALSSYTKGLTKKSDKNWPEIKPYLKESANQLGINIGEKLKAFLHSEGR